MTGTPVLLRELLVHSRRPRTYVFQAAFLGLLVIGLIPLWPAGGDTSNAAIATRGRFIFEYGGYLQLFLLALLAPAFTANAITAEKTSNTLDLLLLTGAGPFSITLGKYLSRVVMLVFLLYLTLPVLFALLTLGGVGPVTVLQQFLLLTAFCLFSAALGVFLSTVMPRPAPVLVAGYLLLGLLLGAPPLLEAAGLVPRGTFSGKHALRAALISPLADMAYLVQPSRFVPTESSPSRWWVAPAWLSAGSVLLVLASGLLLPHARAVEGLFSLRRLLEFVDRLTYLLLRPRLLLKGVRPSEVILPGRERLPDVEPRRPAPAATPASTPAVAAPAGAAGGEAPQEPAEAPQEPAAPAPPAPLPRWAGLPRPLVHALGLGALVAPLVSAAIRLLPDEPLSPWQARGLVGDASLFLAATLGYRLALKTRWTLPASLLGPGSVLLAGFGPGWVAALGFALAWLGTLILDAVYEVPGLAAASAREVARQVVEASRSVGRTNPIYWKETTVNTIGRWRYWWRVNLGLLVLLGSSYLVFQQVLSDIDFHKVVVAVLNGLIVLQGTVIAATTVSREREDGTLVLLATTPMECSTYVDGKLRGIARNVVVLAALPFVHAAIWIAAGVISPWTLVFLALLVPLSVGAAIVQGIYVSLLQPTTLRAIVSAVGVVILESALPYACCLPQLNLPLAGYLAVQPAVGGEEGVFIAAMLLSSVFGAATLLGFMFVIYSLIRSGFDRYVGRST